jgi:predicted RNA binding protein YcfA (HicA-like mRNA interferase family)
MLATVTKASGPTVRPLGNDRTVKVREAIKLLEDDGWAIVATKGSHRQFKHPTRLGRVTVAGKLSADLHPKTQASILRQAGIRT